MPPTKAPAAKRRASIGSQRNPASAEAILAAAEAVLIENGLGNFSIEAVAKRAKAGKPTIYRWWPSKAALLLDVYHHQKHMIPHPDNGEIRTDLAEFITGLLAFWKEGSGGAVFRSIIAEAQNDTAASKALSDYAAERRRASGQMIRNAQIRSEVRLDIDPELVAEMLSSFAWNRLLTDRLETSPEEIQSLVDMVTSGICVSRPD
ncbi:TetR/AcrR family transcriptional regulator [Agrobacterium sp. a22-2]|uniref:TetR/AcrR family transcriptional regulator n=1 Tax=Agrobacterium sp. a22-2 TaxID=2283840 RepID=UPI00144531FA|nr:TetR/AcrR family transcriptional regulator [Agrobacterium sp. a22-2]NKN37161.1 TetR/AcrR family transcriptional regulator [Agrobacterium sp. a22-2]